MENGVGRFLQNTCSFFLSRIGPSPSHMKIDWSILIDNQSLKLYTKESIHVNDAELCSRHFIFE